MFPGSERMPFTSFSGAARAAKNPRIVGVSEKKNNNHAGSEQAGAEPVHGPHLAWPGLAEATALIWPD